MFKGFSSAVFTYLSSLCKGFIVFLLILSQAPGIRSAGFFQKSFTAGFQLRNQSPATGIFYKTAILKGYRAPLAVLSEAPPKKAKALIIAPPVLNDGEPREFSARVMDDEAAAYEWSYETPGKAKTRAAVEFSAPNEAVTSVKAHWYAQTNRGCAAEFSSNYLIKLKVRLRSGEELVERIPLTVEVPHTWGGSVDYPETTGAPEIAFENSRGLWFVKSAGTLRRIIKEPVIRALETSQFYRKIKQHEEVHRQQMSTGIFADLFQINNLMSRLAALSDADRQHLEQKIFEAVQEWRQSESQLGLKRLPKAEKEAYTVSDHIEPRYLFNNCSRF